MSVLVETVDDLHTLVRKFNIKVNSLDELKGLLESVKAQYDPEVARGRTIRAIALAGVIVPFLMAFGASFMLYIGTAGPTSRPLDWLSVMSLGIIWGSAGIVALASIIFALITLLATRRSTTKPTQDAAPAQWPAPAERSTSFIQLGNNP